MLLLTYFQIMSLQQEWVCSSGKLFADFDECCSLTRIVTEVVTLSILCGCSCSHFSDVLLTQKDEPSTSSKSSYKMS